MNEHEKRASLLDKIQALLAKTRANRCTESARVRKGRWMDPKTFAAGQAAGDRITIAHGALGEL